MNRKEAIEILKEIARNPLTINESHLKREEAIRVLEEPLTLADFLGWEENVEYRRGGNYLKIEGNHLLHKGHSGKWVNMNLQTWELIDLRQATKIEPKLKAYHVTDEYSYKCLMEELEEQGYLFDYNSYGSKKPTELRYKLPYGTRGYIYIVGHEDISWNSDFNTSTPNIYNDENYDLIEYHKEEPKFYAKVKGTDELNCVNVYWHFDTYEELLSVSDKDNTECYITLMTKTEWHKLGINDTNADFVEVEE